MSETDIKAGGGLDEAVYEGDVAEQLGLTRKALARVRGGLDLVMGVDWVHGPHRRLMLTPVGVRKIEAAVLKAGNGAEIGENGAEGGDLPSAGVLLKNLNAGRVRAPGRGTARIWRVSGFPKVLECEMGSGDDLRRIRVRVQDNRNFVVGMEIPVREAVGQGPGMYYFDGVLPRRPGVLPAVHRKPKNG